MSYDIRDILVVLGTRPEIIKLAPVIRAIDESEKLTFQLVHTGQHYDVELNEAFFQSLGVPEPDHWLGIGSGAQGEQTAKALHGIEQLILSDTPDIVVALGDTNAVLSAAIATSKTEPKFVHIEAGIRSFDRSMPEEVNRVLADRVSDIAFAPTETAVENLADEGITTNVWEVGNTIVDACHEHAPVAEEESSILSRLGIDSESYAVATIHRPRNTDDVERFRIITEALDNQTFPVIFPAHPRTEAVLSTIDYSPDSSLRLIDPLNYLDFLKLLMNARIVATDSGGIQEEASILEVPCLTVRPNTERPETVEAGVNELVAPNALEERLRSVYFDSKTCESMTGHAHLYGDGAAAERIVKVLLEQE